MSDAERRAAVIAEAESWLRTPYHHFARVKGAGVDCLMLLAEVYERAGVIPHVDPPHYPPDWFKHRSEELYAAGLIEHGREVEYPQPGDAAIFRFGRCYSHGAIVTDWPMMIGAHWSNGVERSDGRNGVFRDRPVKFFDPF